MWERIEVTIGHERHRARWRMEGCRLALEWRGGRIHSWCGLLRPEVVAVQKLRQLVTQQPAAA